LYPQEGAFDNVGESLVVVEEALVYT